VIETFAYKLKRRVLTDEGLAGSGCASLEHFIAWLEEETQDVCGTPIRQAWGGWIIWSVDARSGLLQAGVDQAVRLGRGEVFSPRR
jgi:hypothetical protein